MQTFISPIIFFVLLLFQLLLNPKSSFVEIVIIAFPSLLFFVFCMALARGFRYFWRDRSPRFAFLFHGSPIVAYIALILGYYRQGAAGTSFRWFFILAGVALATAISPLIYRAGKRLSNDSNLARSLGVVLVLLLMSPYFLSSPPEEEKTLVVESQHPLAMACQQEDKIQSTLPLFYPLYSLITRRDFCLFLPDFLALEGYENRSQVLIILESTQQLEALPAGFRKPLSQ
ncbi:hypothetical protein [Pseudobacteriovorax antillogorgiicola]|uniref:Uncharacterized protein n=1 Tax=Pseudobacteriovorax antillogorgiicola TaxID=1513793 RepID=A0A1Y6C1J8_9BACT|nr:hypothetical protein [Pseudobacteriovorax antillogorgiicola]TCS50712.1 hypothetical protein EDD56_11295 [Pseudobacteriovorax antillogorgiicola]SMF40627.1 hypothetical protein SAMN06296036_11294 [Pseudobacteriovorax antillogorgiicola]